MWKGIDTERDVDIYYRCSNTSGWEYCGHRINHAYKLLMPSMVKRLNDNQTVIQSIYYENQDTIAANSLIRHAAITGYGERAITINMDKILKIWDLKDGNIIFKEKLNNLDNIYIVNPNHKTLLV